MRKYNRNNIVKLFGMNEMRKKELNRHTKIDYDAQIIN